MRFEFDSRVDPTTGRRMTVSLRMVLWGIGGFLAVLAVIFAFVWRSVGAEGRLLAAEAVETTAEVIDKRQVETRDTGRDIGDRDIGDRDRSRTSYYLVLAYTPAGGTRLETETSVSRAAYDAAKLGSTMPLYYAASDPGVTEMTPGGRAGDAVVMGWVAVVLGVLAGVMAVLGMVFGAVQLHGRVRG